jgi:hypothetical protein
MTTKSSITKEYFTKRLADLCIKSGLQDLPKDLTDQHILLKSAILMVGQPGSSLTEKEVTEKLELWFLEVGQIKFLDPVTIRRTLVDRGYLTRSKDGSSYQVSQPGSTTVTFDDEVDRLDIAEVIAGAREDIARRKREYMDKAKARNG